MTTGITTALEAADISVSGQLLLRNVSLVLHRGTLTIISAPDGCGASHVLRILWGALPLQNGRVICDDTDMTHAPSRRWAAWRRQIGIFCDDFPFAENWTASANVATALYAAEKLPGHVIARRTIDELRQWGLLACRFVHAHRLSRSQRVRLGLARAFVRGPLAVFLDNPLAHLSPVEQGHLLEIIRRKARAGSAVCLTIGEQTVVHGDELYRIENERIIHVSGKRGPARCGTIF